MSSHRSILKRFQKWDRYVTRVVQVNLGQPVTPAQCRLYSRYVAHLNARVDRIRDSPHVCCRSCWLDIGSRYDWFTITRFTGRTRCCYCLRSIAGGIYIHNTSRYTACGFKGGTHKRKVSSEQLGKSAHAFTVQRA